MSSIEEKLKNVGDEFENFQTEVLKKITIPVKPPTESPVKPPTESPVKPSTESSVSASEDKSETTDSEDNLQIGEDTTFIPDKLPKSITDDETIVVGSDPTKIVEDVKEQTILPKLTDITSEEESKTTEDKEKEKESKKIINIQEN